MSCGDPHEMDCSQVLDHLYEYLDHEMDEDACDKFREHFGECNPCLEKYGLEQAVKKLVKRCCGHDEVPGDLRAKVLTRIALIRTGEIAVIETSGREAAADYESAASHESAAGHETAADRETAAGQRSAGAPAAEQAGTGSDRAADEAAGDPARTRAERA